MISDKRCQIIFNISFVVICCVLGIVDHLNALEFFYFADFYSYGFKISCLIFIFAHPIVLFFYNIVILTYLSYLSENDFLELTSDFEYYEMIYFREKVKSSYLWLLPLTIYLTIVTYLKFFSLYSLKFLIEKPGSVTIFKNVITTTLYPAVIIQSIFQSLPQIILQSLNNLLILEDKHNMRGVFNFSTIFSIMFLLTNIVLYYRDNEMIKHTTSEKNKEILNNI
jgi:hypothetical protein